MDIVGKIRRGLKKPISVILERIKYEISAEIARAWEPFFPGILSRSFLLRQLNAKSLDQLWTRIGEGQYPAFTNPISPVEYDKLTHKGASEYIFQAADRALNNIVNLLGAGDVELGQNIEWNKDYKTNISWENKYFRSISYSNLDKPSDVKFPWEVSRMQWMIPLGQAYLLTQDEKYAEKVKTLLTDWIHKNPFAGSVNWTCTMEVALRIVTWTWFFHVFKKSTAWKDELFRELFLKSLYLHAFFTERHLEKSDVNGNHYTADATGLVFAGLFFQQGKKPNVWSDLGWDILTQEIKLQVFDDGVDYEASVPYHRLVQELFFFPALYRTLSGLSVPDFYNERLKNMADFTACYSRNDGSVPLWGDADDARTLPFGPQDINDHRYLLGLVGRYLGNQKLIDFFSGQNEEIFWTYGPQTAKQILSRSIAVKAASSQDFPDGGFYIMRDKDSHVFIDCGPLGLKGRGGHGHNDILSFELVLDGVQLIVDSGAYLYTANYKERNNFRSTAYHNTPQIDGVEINRFIREDYLWNLHNDAEPIVYNWDVHQDYDLFEGGHTGYLKIDPTLEIRRKIKLDKKTHAFYLEDMIISERPHDITIPFHFHPDVKIIENGTNSFVLESQGKKFELKWEGSLELTAVISDSRVSPSYGVVKTGKKLTFTKNGRTPRNTFFVNIKSQM